MNKYNLSERMFDRTNSFIISANMVSKISNKEVVKHLVKDFFHFRVTFTKAFDAVRDGVTNLTKVEFVKVTFNKVNETHFKLDLERVTSLNELAKSYFIINDVNAAIAALICKAAHPNISINSFFYRCGYIDSMSGMMGAATLPLTPKTITLPDEDTLEALREEYYRKWEEAMNIDIPTDYVVEATEDAGYKFLPDDVEDAIIVE